MDAAIEILKNAEKNKIIYPQTRAEAVYFSDGITIADKITDSISPENEGLPTSDAVYKALQNIEVVTEDTKNTTSSTAKENTKLYVVGAPTQENFVETFTNSNIYISNTNVLMGAAWNDFAEFRISREHEPGRVICENGDGTLSLSKNRLQPGAEVISDTYGFAIGETEQCKTPVAIVGRVLAYPSDTLRIGDAVCAGPCGTVSAMTREEIKEYPDRIIGIVSEIPTYEYWNDKVKVNGRVWIRIK